MNARKASGPGGSADHVVASLDRAARSAHRLARELAGNREQLVQLMTIRARRAWTADEFERYLALSRADTSLQRSYAAALRTFDHARLRPPQALGS